MKPKDPTNKDLAIFENIEGISIPKLFPRISTLLTILIIFIICCLFLPWIQTSRGNGSITTLHPEDRLQKITAPVGGRIEKWYVRDGIHLSVGDKIVEIRDVDPQNIERINNEINATKERLDAASIATQLSLKNFNRQKTLFNKGLTSRKDMEAANITYQKTLGEQKYYQTQLISYQASLRKQQNQLITAQRSGYITNTLSSSSALIVSPGQELATFVPDSSEDTVAEIYVTGNDIPLIKIGQHVRLIFDGWPTIQFSGWPSVSIGTFPGIVKVVDYAASSNGLFRVIVVPDNDSSINWPNKVFLRLGTKTYGYIQMNEVKLGYELWRQLNGFPISINNKQNRFEVTDKDIKYNAKNSAGGDNSK